MALARDYPLWRRCKAPLDCSSVKHWTADEAKANSEWLQKVMPVRVEALLSFLMIPARIDPVEQLTLLDHELRLVLRDPQFSFDYVDSEFEDEHLRGVTEAGQQLALDAGLFLAWQLIRAHPGTFYVAARTKTNATDAYRNSPVVTAKGWSSNDWRQFALYDMSEVQAVRLSYTEVDDISGFLPSYSRMLEYAEVGP